MFLISACNTVSGIGEDLQKAGQAVSSGSQKTKEKLSN